MAAAAAAVRRVAKVTERVRGRSGVPEEDGGGMGRLGEPEEAKGARVRRRRRRRLRQTVTRRPLGGEPLEKYIEVEVEEAEGDDARRKLNAER